MPKLLPSHSLVLYYLRTLPGQKKKKINAQNSKTFLLFPSKKLWLESTSIQNAVYLDASNTLFEFKYRMTALNSEWKKKFICEITTVYVITFLITFTERFSKISQTLSEFEASTKSASTAPIFNFEVCFLPSTDFQLTSEVWDCLEVWLMLTSGNWGEADAKLLNKIFTGQWISGTPFAPSEEEMRIASWWWGPWGNEIITGKKGLTPPSVKLILEVEKNEVLAEVSFEDNDSSSKTALPLTATKHH